MGFLTRVIYGEKRTIRFYKLFLSYVLLVITLLLIIGSAVYSGIITALQKEVELANVSAVSQIRDNMDMRLRELQRISLQISSNPLLTPYMLTQSGYETYKAVTELGKYRSSNSFIHNIVLAFNHQGNEQLYAATGIYGDQEFFKHIYKYEHWGSRELKETIEIINAPIIRPIENVYINNTSTERFATYLYPLPAYSGKPYGAVMFILDEKVFMGMTEHLLKNYNGYLYMLDEKNQPIFSVRSDNRILDENIEKHILQQPEGERDSAAIKQIGDVAYSVIRVSSTYNRWTFVTAIPTSQILSKVERSRHIFGVTLIAILVIGTLLSFTLANSNYQKLRQLVLLFSEKNGTSAMPGGNMDEISFLSEAIKGVSSENSLMMKLNSKTGLIREKVLLSLLKGKHLETEDLENMLQASGVRFKYQTFVTVLFVIDDYPSFQAKHSATMQELFKFSIINVAEELSTEIGRGYGIDVIDDRGVALVLGLEENHYNKRRLQEFAENTQTFFKTYYKFTLSAGIGRLYEQLSSVSSSYREAQQALYYRFMKGTEQILFFEDVNVGSQESKYSYPNELEEQLVKILRQGNTDEAERLVRSIIGYIRTLSSTPEAALTACSGFLNTLMKTWSEMQPDDQGGLRQEMEALLSLRPETAHVLEEQIVILCRQVCEENTKRKESKNFDLRDEILAYIHMHYADSSITLESIAARFQMSPSYITRFIKDQTGHSLIRYLDLIRMEKAKELLKSGQLSLQEIVNEVGYVDTSNFIRKFKKSEGVTPAQFRQLFRRVSAET